MKRFFYLIVLLVVTISSSSCDTLKKLYFGIGKTEVIVRDSTQVLKYYEPFLSNGSYTKKVFVLSDFGAANKMIDSAGTLRVFIKDRKTKIIYNLDCYEDIKENIADIKNGTPEDYTIIKNTDDLVKFRAFLNNKNVKEIFSYQENHQNDVNKRWDIYISHAVFMGKKVRRRLLAVISLKEINELIILDLSVHESSREI